MIIQQIIMMLVTQCTLAREVFKVSRVVKVQSFLAGGVRGGGGQREVQ